MREQQVAGWTDALALARHRPQLPFAEAGKNRKDKMQFESMQNTITIRIDPSCGLGVFIWGLHGPWRRWIENDCSQLSDDGVHTVCLLHRQGCVTDFGQCV